MEKPELMLLAEHIDRLRINMTNNRQQAMIDKAYWTYMYSKDRKNKQALQKLMETNGTIAQAESVLEFFDATALRIANGEDPLKFD